DTTCADIPQVVVPSAWAPPWPGVGPALARPGPALARPEPIASSQAFFAKNMLQRKLCKVIFAAMAKTSIASGGPRSTKRLTDPRALLALAHPIRMSLIGLLRTEGPLTATRAGELLRKPSPPYP